MILLILVFKLRNRAQGEIVRVQKNVAYHDLLPRRLAVYPTEEYMKLYEKDREEVASKSKVSQFAAQTREQLNKMILQIPVNMSTDWKLTVDSIRIALRYNVSNFIHTNKFNHSSSQ